MSCLAVRIAHAVAVASVIRVFMGMSIRLLAEEGQGRTNTGKHTVEPTGHSKPGTSRSRAGCGVCYGGKLQNTLLGYRRKNARTKDVLLELACDVTLQNRIDRVTLVWNARWYGLKAIRPS
jgi:hypothetical protein